MGGALQAQSIGAPPARVSNARGPPATRIVAKVSDRQQKAAGQDLTDARPAVMSATASFLAFRLSFFLAALLRAAAFAISSSAHSGASSSAGTIVTLLRCCCFHARFGKFDWGAPWLSMPGTLGAFFSACRAAGAGLHIHFTKLPHCRGRLRQGTRQCVSAQQGAAQQRPAAGTLAARPAARSPLARGVPYAVCRLAAWTPRSHARRPHSWYTLANPS